MDMQEAFAEGAFQHAEFARVQHMAQANPANLVDPWWINEVLTRGYPELRFKQWPVDLEDAEPGVIDGRLPPGVELVMRAALLTRRQVECVVASDGAIATLTFSRQLAWVGVAGKDKASSERLLDLLEAAFPASERFPSDETPAIGLRIWGLSDDSRGFRKV